MRKINYLIFIPFLMLFFGTANAYQPAQYNQNCVNGGTIQGFQCNPEKLTNAEAHSFCTTQQMNGGGAFLDCMGSFIPFVGAERNRTSQSCENLTSLTYTWSQHCQAPIPAGLYNDGQRETITNTADGYTGHATYRCNNGDFVLESGTSICTPTVKSCDLSDYSNSWLMTNLVAIGQNTTNTIDIDFNAASTDWANLGLISQLNTLRNMNCHNSNLSGTSEMYEKFVITPDSSNVREISDTSLHFGNNLLVDTNYNYFGNLPSYTVAYCYDGEIGTNRTRDYFRSSSRKMVDAGIIDNNYFNDLMAEKCSVSLADCSAQNHRITGSQGAMCDFGVNASRHGDDPLFRTQFQNHGSTANPDFFGVDDRSHGKARFSCFNGNVVRESGECHLTPRCNDNAKFNNDEQNIYTSRFTVENPNNSMSDREIVAEAIELKRDELQTQCDDLSIEGIGGSLTSIGTDFYRRNIQNNNAELTLKAECSFIVAPTNLCSVGKQDITDAFLIADGEVEVEWTCENGLVQIDCDSRPSYDFPDPEVEPVLFTDEWVIAGAVTEGGRNLGKNDFGRFDENSNKDYVLPDPLKKSTIISLDRVRLAGNDGDHSSRGGNATGRAKDMFESNGCSINSAENFEEYSYTRSRSFGTNRHYGVVMGICPCSVSSDVEACEQGTQPNVFEVSSGGGGGGGDYRPPGDEDAIKIE